MDDAEFKLLEKSESDVAKQKEDIKEKLKEYYYTIKDFLKQYCDMKDEYYVIIPLWILGTYFQSHFPSYPYLYFNAMKSSGKTRTMGLIISLSKEGQMLNSLTEAVLFRTTGTLGIDEFEGVERKGKEGLRELLNSAYKKGVSVKRVKKIKSDKGEEQVIEEFDVYRPIVMANIWGMENVLEDRCISIILERSDKKEITNLVEIFREDPIIKQLLQEMEVLSKNNLCCLCSDVTLGNVYKEWNKYVRYTYTNNTNNTNNNNTTNNTNNTSLFKTIKNTGIGGRDLELCLPLFLIANEISEELLNETTRLLQEMMVSKREEEFVENRDVSLIDFISQYSPMVAFNSVNRLTTEFRNFLSSDEDWINTKWMGKALKRLNLFKEKRRTHQGAEVILNIVKAQEKIKMFK